MTDHARTVVDHLRSRGYDLPADPLALEIIEMAIKCWGVDKVMRGLDRQLDGESPTYALESVGAALGAEYECPHQLIRIE